MPVISIIMPAYNAEPYIRQAIESVIGQTIRNWEMIIIDDGSADNTTAIVQSYVTMEPRIRYMTQPNQGEALARAKGFNEANGEYIYFLDADDIAMPYALERLLTTLQNHPNAVAAYGPYLRIGKSGQLLFPCGRQFSTTPSRSGNILPVILQGSFFAIGAVMARRNCLNYDDINVPTQYAEDWVMWCRLAMKGDFIYSGKTPLVKYRVHNQSQTRRVTTHELWKNAIDIVYDDPKLMTLLSAGELHRLEKKRRAFGLFAIGCKEYARGDFEAAALHIKRSIKLAYWRSPMVWGVYFLAYIGWLPAIIKRHFA